MTRRSKIILGSVLGALLTILVLYETRWKEPSYHGKSLSQWLAEGDNAPREEQLKVIEAVQHMGKRSLPHLFEMLHARDWPARQKVVEFMNEYTLIKTQPEVPEERLRGRALVGLAALRDKQPRSIVRHLMAELEP